MQGLPSMNRRRTTNGRSAQCVAAASAPSLSGRRTKTPSVSQGLVACGKCGYALYRTSARTTARKISCYRCLGSDAWRYLNGQLCDSRPVRQDLLDDIVWTELVRLLEDPALVQAEIERHLEAARVSDPNQQREADLRHRLVRVRKGIDRLVTAYQEELITIDELRDRTPELRRQEQALHRELESAVDRAKDRETYLRLAETLTGFLARLRSSAETLDIAERQRIVRLLVKEILVSEDKITIRHSIPIAGSSGGGPDPSKPGGGGPEDESCLLRPGRPHDDNLHEQTLVLVVVVDPGCPQPTPDQSCYALLSKAECCFFLVKFCDSQSEIGAFCPQIEQVSIFNFIRRDRSRRTGRAKKPSDVNSGAFCVRLSSRSGRAPGRCKQQC